MRKNIHIEKKKLMLSYQNLTLTIKFESNCQFFSEITTINGMINGHRLCLNAIFLV